MKAALLALALLPQPVADESTSSDASQSLDCSYGGFLREFGGTQWMVFGCIDRKTIVIYSAKGNPAMPFYFIRFPKGDSFSLYGEGNGDKTATAPAFEALKAMTETEWAQLLAELNASPKYQT